MGQFILHAVQGEDEDVARVAVGVISDIANALEESVEQYVTSFAKPLLDILRNEARDRHTKL